MIEIKGSVKKPGLGLVRVDIPGFSDEYVPGAISCNKCRDVNSPTVCISFGVGRRGYVPGKSDKTVEFQESVLNCPVLLALLHRRDAVGLAAEVRRKIDEGQR